MLRYAKAVFFEPFISKTIILPRQAREKHKELSKNGPFSCRDPRGWLGCGGLRQRRRGAQSACLAALALIILALAVVALALSVTARLHWHYEFLVLR